MTSVVQVSTFAVQAMVKEVTTCMRQQLRLSSASSVRPVLQSISLRLCKKSYLFTKSRRKRTHDIEMYACIQD